VHKSLDMDEYLVKAKPHISHRAVRPVLVRVNPNPIHYTILVMAILCKGQLATCASLLTPRRLTRPGPRASPATVADAPDASAAQ